MSTRAEKVASQIQEDMAELVREYQRSNIVTVTHVHVTDDLGIAKIYISVLGGDEYATFERIQSASDELRFNLASRVRHQLRRVPELQIYEDNSAAYAQHMEEVFQKIHKDEDEEPSSDEAGNRSDNA